MHMAWHGLLLRCIERFVADAGHQALEDTGKCLLFWGVEGFVAKSGQVILCIRHIKKLLGVLRVEDIRHAAVQSQ